MRVGLLSLGSTIITLLTWIGASCVTMPPEPWFGIAPIAAGVFGVPLGFGVCVVVSLLTPAPAAAQRRLWRELRHPPRADVQAEPHTGSGL